MWVLDYLEDIDSDMSVFHRVDEPRTTMPTGLYFERAVRLPAYDGIMRIRAREDAERGGPVVVSAPIVSDDWIEHDTGGVTT